VTKNCWDIKYPAASSDNTAERCHQKAQPASAACDPGTESRLQPISLRVKPPESGILLIFGTVLIFLQPLSGGILIPPPALRIAYPTFCESLANLVNPFRVAVGVSNFLIQG